MTEAGRGAGRKGGLVVGIVLVVIVTELLLFLFGVWIAVQCMKYTLVHGKAELTDDFSDGLKARCYEEGFLFNASCEFVAGARLRNLNGKDWVIFRLPETADSSFLYAALQEKTLDIPEFPDVLRKAAEGLRFCRKAEGIGSSGLIRLTLYQSEPKAGYVYFYLCFED